MTFDFAEEYAQAARIALPRFPSPLPLVSKGTLIAMKKSAGRSIDIDDIQDLTSDA